MKNQYTAFVNEKVAIRPLMLKDVNNLLEAGFLYKSVLDQSLGNGFSKMVGVLPHSTGLVACHVEKDHAFGFLSLVEHTNWLYSIKWVFVDPKFRQKGIATGLINYAKSLARERGARKVFLNANSNDDSLFQFYVKRGFALITESSMVWGGGLSKNLQEDNSNSLTPSKVCAKENKDQTFDFYKKCMGQGWIDFFEINSKNLLNGFSQDYGRLFSKSAFIINPPALALISKLPFLHTGFTEFYVPSDANISSVLNGLSLILSKKGVLYSKITVFNVNGTECFDLLKGMEFYPFQARILGITF